MISKFRQSVFRVLLLSFLVFVGYQLFDFLNKGMPPIVGFLKAGGDHDVVRDHKIPYFKPVLEASRLIPESESVRLSLENLRMIDIIAIRYALYPVKVNEVAKFELAPNKEKFKQDVSLNKYPLSHGALLLYPPNISLVPKDPNKRFLFTEFGVFLLVSLIIAAIGMNFLKSIGFTPNTLGLFWFWGTGYLVGFVVLNFVYWALLMAHFHLNISIVLGVLGVVFCVSQFIGMLNSKAHNSLIGYRDKNDESSIDRSSNSQRTVQSLALFLIAMIVLVTISIPITVWDEMLIWVLRAKMLFHEGVFDFHYLSQTNVYYPNLWPLHIHIFFKLLGGCHSEALKWISASVFLSFVAQFHGACMLLKIKRMSTWFWVCVYCLVFMNFIFFTALPENIFFALSLGMVIALILWLNDQRKRFLMLAFVMAMGLSGVKFEGGVIVCALIICLVVVGLLSRVSLRKLSLLLWLLIPCAVQVIWVSWLKSNGYTYSIYHFAHSFEWGGIYAICQVVIQSLLQGKNLFVLILMSLLFVFAANHRPWDNAERLLVLVICVFIGFSFTSVVFWPMNDIRLYFPEVLDRLFLRATPFVMLLWMSRVFDRKI